MDAIIYCRVSTFAQGEDGVSLDMQRTRAEAFCVSNGYTVRAVMVETMSGAEAANRPELQRALTLVCESKGILVVYALSRLTRSIRDTLSIADRLDRAQANLASLTERIDTASAVGRMVFRLLATMNQYERELLAERTAGAMAHARRLGRRISHCVPFGHDLQPATGMLVTNDAEQRVVAQMQSWRASGLSFARIALKLNEAGMPTKQGGRWMPASVRSILVRQVKLAA
jgi:site-specific DNA recombinase